MKLVHIATYGAGKHRFEPDEFPGATHMIVTVQGGRGGNSVNGTPGELGTSSTSKLIPTEGATIEVGPGGRGSMGGKMEKTD